MNYADRLRKLCARIGTSHDLEEVEKDGAELRTLLRHPIEDFVSEGTSRTYALSRLD
jgi:hypothetical protein